MDDWKDTDHFCPNYGQLSGNVFMEIILYNGSLLINKIKKFIDYTLFIYLKIYELTSECEGWRTHLDIHEGIFFIKRIFFAYRSLTF